jgi:hypothetical protein
LGEAPRFHLEMVALAKSGGAGGRARRNRTADLFNACHGPPFLTISDSLHFLLKPLKISVFWIILISGRFQQLLFGGDLVAI